jgi:hypothetical protein
MTHRSFVLAIVAVFWPMLVAPAQTIVPPAVADPEPAKPAKVEEDAPAKLRQMQEDLTVFRILFNRSAARYYNFPTTYADKAHIPPAAEGVYLKGQGVTYTCGLPQPAKHPVNKTESPQADSSAWQRTLLELRGEKPSAPETKPADAAKKSVSEVFLTLLAENGHHFSKLAEQERITIAVTFYPNRDCTRCHGAGMDFRAATGKPPGYLNHRLGSKQTDYSPSMAPMSGGGSGGGGASGMAPRDDEQIDIQIGDLALKQGRYKEAGEAYQRIIQKLSARKELENDVRRLTLLAEVSSKLAQSELAAGQSDKARNALELAQKFSQAAVKAAGPQGKTKTETLPAQLILSASKSQLDQVAGRKISFEEFSKMATVEYRTFDAPEPKKQP